MTVDDTDFRLGDLVETVKGAKFWGEIIAFDNDGKSAGCTVLAIAPGFEGTKHVYPLKQLRHRPPGSEAVAWTSARELEDVGREIVGRMWRTSQSEHDVPLYASPSTSGVRVTDEMVEAAFEGLGMTPDEERGEHGPSVTRGDMRSALELVLSALASLPVTPAERGDSARVAEKLSEIRQQLAINVAIAERDHPEGPIVDGKRIKAMAHSQAILASHVEDRLKELEALLASPPLPVLDGGWRGMESAPKDGYPILAYRPPEFYGKKATLVFVAWNAEEQAWIWPSDIYDPVHHESYSDAYEAGDFFADMSFTHWMPLPTSPEVSDAE